VVVVVGIGVVAHDIVSVGDLVFRLHELRQVVLLIVVFFDVVEVVHPAGELGRDWALRRALFLLIRLLWTFAFGWRRGTKVAATAAGPLSFTRTSRAWTAEASGSWTAEAPTSSAGTRAAEAAARRAWSTKAATSAAWARSIPARSWTAWSARTARWSARSAIFTRARLAHGKRSPHEQLAIELSNCRLGGVAIGVLDERKAPSAAGFAIERSHDLRRFTNLREVQSQVFFGGLVGKISYEKSNWWHGCRWAAGLGRIRSLCRRG
jgi:hypothetical protein